MSGTWFDQPAFWSYGVAAVTYATFAAHLYFARRGGGRGLLLLSFVLLGALWAAVAAAQVISHRTVLWRAAHVLDALRFAAAAAFVVALMGPALGASADSRRYHFGYLGIAALTFVLILFAEPPAAGELTHAAGGLVAMTLMLLRAIVGLVLVEQLYRRMPPLSRWNVRPLCLALGGVFIYEVVLFTDGVLHRVLDPHLWNGLGFVHAVTVPLLGVAAARNREWKFAVSLSRPVIAGSATLFAVGLYLLVVAAGGYYVRDFGGSWGRVLEVVILFAALLFLGLVLLSGTFRAQLRVFISKHFFAYRYDYRVEWLKFTQALADGPPNEAKVRCIRALAELVESPAGALWLMRDDSVYAEAARYNLPAITQTEPAAGPFATQLARSGWVIDLNEARRRPAAAEGFALPGWLLEATDLWLVVPLSVGNALIGFVALAQPRVRVDLNWEVRDLLKTAGCQAASYLAMLEANEALLEARKFEAFNRLSAFVVHDLKNIVAQLQLLLRNAERHRDKPKFHRDMQATIEHAVARMNQLMMQLRAGTTPIESSQPVDLATVVRRCLANRTNCGVAIEQDLELGVTVLGHPDRLERVVGHLVQNALDAVRDHPCIRVRVWREAAHGVIEVIDNGIGMTPEFVRDRLFRPFQSTKSMGMGIGAYESRQYVSSIGGRIEVDSQPGVGTTMRVRLPLAAQGMARPAHQEAA
ncbi:MAG: PEP-CTERM system histidine kinase PrsK [Sutterellaceae bacterium]|nr:PEP-CTERM system histidine kinase PrsK [Burkholderiaceae bacterium]MDW8429577.1 PEP-CTERM system histidine kinase PrsK [Sutterellaceae bacterium]